MIMNILCVLTWINTENNNYGNPRAQTDDDGAQDTFDVDIV